MSGGSSKSPGFYHEITIIPSTAKLFDEQEATSPPTYPPTYLRSPIPTASPTISPSTNPSTSNTNTQSVKSNNTELLLLTNSATFAVTSIGISLLLSPKARGVAKKALGAAQACCNKVTQCSAGLIEWFNSCRENSTSLLGERYVELTGSNA